MWILFMACVRVQRHAQKYCMHGAEAINFTIHEAIKCPQDTVYYFSVAVYHSLHHAEIWI